MTTASGLSGFSSSESAALERETDAPDASEPAVSFLQIWNETHKKICTGWIRQNNYKSICLQFPDQYLVYSDAICDNLKELLASVQDCKVFVLADTTYGSCCVDEVAAAHVGGDCIVHFGNACCNKSKLPVLYIYPHLPLNVDDLWQELANLRELCEGLPVCVYLDIGYHYVPDDRRVIQSEGGVDYMRIKLMSVLNAKDVLVRCFPSTDEAPIASSDRICIFIGSDNSRFANLSLTTTAARWYIYDPASKQLKETNPLTANFIRRRYFYIEKCKDAKVLGLTVATLASDSHLAVVARIQEMAKFRGVRTQLISVGRINPAKLANFLEIDCFVLIGCPFNNMFTSRDYYKPIVSVFEAEMALNPAWHMKYPESYVLDFKQILPEGSRFLEFKSDGVPSEDVSLVNGCIRRNVNNEEESSTSNDQYALTNTGRRELIAGNAGLTFEDRSWQGLDPALGQNEPAKLQKGLSGIPVNYTHE